MRSIAAPQDLMWGYIGGNKAKRGPLYQEKPRPRTTGFPSLSRLETYREQESNLHVPGTPDPELFPDGPCAVLTNSEFVDP